MWNKFYFYRHDHQYGIFLLYKSGYYLVTNRVKIIILPLVAGVSYEFIRLAGSSDHPLVQIFSKPGLALQKLTTKEPDHSMIEVAIASVEGVFDWREYLENLHKGEQKEDE